MDKTSVILLILSCTSFVLIFVFFTFLVVSNNIKRKRKFLIEKQNRESEFKQELLHTQLEMQEHTFQNISQEIHDNVGQILSLVKLHLNILTASQSVSPQLMEIKEQVNNAITELRNLSNGYYGEKLADMGLQTAIRNQLTHLEKTGLYTINFYSEIDHVVIDRSKTIFLYRMMQEIFNNVVKHAAADHITVKLLAKEDKIHILVKDNGKGFAIEDKHFVPGIGLSSMRNRAAMIQAILIIESEENNGTTVNLVCSPRQGI
ncbi:sensor histidine kinase [Sediminibacterium soli]|uniref:sensor histidine kinase n=1 Tax=Sediminibacterium soli TaxID=2698829 RepID=UPI00137A5BDE|nr:ATP-binding protein [Sediminibacterium soli]NCI47989.1 hypothetical protein [Sediminibacterium soli]